MWIMIFFFKQIGELDKKLFLKIYAEPVFLFHPWRPILQKMSVSSKWWLVTRVGPSEILGDHVTVTTKNTVGFTGEVHKKQHHNLKD